jgi:hypothetical protein
VVLRETARAVTPFGGLSVFFEFLSRIGYAAAIRQHMPVVLTSPNAIEPAQTFTGFLVSVLAGARRFAHAGWLRADRALHALMGLRRFPIDDTIRNLFKRFGHKEVYQFYAGLTRWQLQRLPEREGGYSLDLDSTVFERYGRQEGAKKGHNPRKHGRPSHHPLLAVLAEAHFVLHGWLRSGNCGAARGVVEFLKEALGLWETARIRVVRADSGFFEEKLLEYLEERRWGYIVVARMTRLVKRELNQVVSWRDLDADYAVGEFRAQLLGWSRARRFVVVRERLREERPSPGRRLFEAPGYSFRVLVTSRAEAPEEIWRDYNQRSDMEKRIAELKYDLAADDFCMRQFFATEAAFLAILLLFNLLAEFQRALGFVSYRQPATLRSQVFLCGAVLGRAGHRLVLHLSSAWGGLTSRNALFDKILDYCLPTSPKLNPESSPGS